MEIKKVECDTRTQIKKNGITIEISDDDYGYISINGLKYTKEYGKEPIGFSTPIKNSDENYILAETLRIFFGIHKSQVENGIVYMEE